MTPPWRPRYRGGELPGPSVSGLIVSLAVTLALAGLLLEAHAWHVITTVGIEHAPWWVLFLAFGGR